MKEVTKLSNSASEVVELTEDQIQQVYGGTGSNEADNDDFDKCW